MLYYIAISAMLMEIYLLRFFELLAKLFYEQILILLKLIRSSSEK
jgi:hypothetical protein